jgi:hypothetical protein
MHSCLLNVPCKTPWKFFFLGYKEKIKDQRISQHMTRPYFREGGRHYNPSQQTFSLSKLATPRNLEWDSFLHVIRNIEDMVLKCKQRFLLNVFLGHCHGLQLHLFRKNNSLCANKNLINKAE